jgi:hypothetical protein
VSGFEKGEENVALFYKDFVPAGGFGEGKPEKAAWFVFSFLTNEVVAGPLSDDAAEEFLAKHDLDDDFDDEGLEGNSP